MYSVQTVSQHLRCPFQVVEHDRPVLSLASLIGQADAHESATLRCGVEPDMLALLIEGHSFPYLRRDFVQCPGLHKHAQLALQTTPQWDSTCSFSQLVLYTDGSFKPQHDAVGYAVVALVEVQGQWQFAGVFSGAVSFHYDDDGVEANAHTAELCGMIHARLIHVACSPHGRTTIRYDCESACQVMKNASSKGSPLNRLASSIAAICFQLCIATEWQHVAGHSGDPWNELADFIAKQSLDEHLNRGSPVNDAISDLLKDDSVSWLWVALAARQQPASWPKTSQEGHFVSNAVTTDQCLVGPLDIGTPDASGVQHPISIRVITYNTLSLEVSGQIECLEEHFGHQAAHIVGLQECRQHKTKAGHGNHFFRFASDPQHGQGRCQIWLSKHFHPGSDRLGNPLRWRTETFACHHAEPRCLAISGKAGDVMFGLVSAHAHTSTTDEDISPKFWQKLACVVGKLPENAIKIVMLDANATFDPHRRQGWFYFPKEGNAEAMCAMMRQTGLAASDLWDVSGREVHTWCSPSGFLKALDFVLVPQNMRYNLQTIGADTDLLDMFGGIDHRPLVIELMLTVVRQVQHTKRPVFDVKAMETPEGQHCLHDIFMRAPSVDWNAHASVHWNCLRDHLHGECAKFFPLKGKGPRKTYISEPLWALIHEQRQLRGELRYRKQGAAKWRQNACFQAWKLYAGNFAIATGSRRQQTLMPDLDWLRRHDRSVALAWRQLTEVRCNIRRLMQTCRADQARLAFEEARQDGPGAIARLMTSLMQSGRRYKPPQTLPPIKGQDGKIMTNENDIFAALGEHFARAEKAIRVDAAQYAEVFHGQDRGIPSSIEGCDVPGVSDLAQAFRKTKQRKAPGLSGLGPEVFRSVANSAAVVVYPILPQATHAWRSS